MANGRLTTMAELPMTSENLSETGRRVLTTEEKRMLYRDGFIILKGAVPKELTRAAKERLKASAKDGNRLGLAKSKEMLDLVNASSITPVLQEAMGAFDAPTTCQVGQNPVRKPGKFFTSVGYRDKDVPYFGANTHIDGICTIGSGIPQDPNLVKGLTPEQKYQYYINAGKNAKGEPLNAGKAPDALPGRPTPGKSCEVMGENQVPLFEDKECTLGLGSFTAFAFVCLNDQTRPGRGQTAVLKGSHHSAERFFQMQREAGGIMGIEGPGWPRLNYNAANGLGLNYLPEPLFDEFCDEAKYGPLERSADGRVWPRPVQVLMEEGDACFTVFHIAHTGTRNEGTESRDNIIFRIRAKAHNPNVIVNGISDHLDRGQNGEWLDPRGRFHRWRNPIDTSRDLEKEWFDPFERSKHLLCHPWEVWEGMRQIVAEERAKEEIGTDSGVDRTPAPRARL